jgi:hypothetical protein
VCSAWSLRARTTETTDEQRTGRARERNWSLDRGRRRPCALASPSATCRRREKLRTNTGFEFGDGAMRSRGRRHCSPPPPHARTHATSVGLRRRRAKRALPHSHKPTRARRRRRARVDCKIEPPATGATARACISLPRSRRSAAAAESPATRVPKRAATAGPLYRPALQEAAGAQPRRRAARSGRTTRSGFVCRDNSRSGGEPKQRQQQQRQKTSTTTPSQIFKCNPVP